MDKKGLYVPFHSPTIPVANPFRSSNQLDGRTRLAIGSRNTRCYLNCLLCHASYSADEHGSHPRRDQHRLDQEEVPQLGALFPRTRTTSALPLQTTLCDERCRLTQLRARYPAAEVIVPKIINGRGPYLSKHDPPMMAKRNTRAACSEPIQAVTDLLRRGHTGSVRLALNRRLRVDVRLQWVGGEVIIVIVGVESPIRSNHLRTQHRDPA